MCLYRRLGMGLPRDRFGYAWPAGIDFSASPPERDADREDKETEAIGQTETRHPLSK